MKTSKKALKTSAQEECGVWLDTMQLKEKAKQKRIARPISKLLNPFAGGGGYNLAVALNFTQTKMEMPKTKQSSISTFFTRHRRVLNKMSTSEAPTMDRVQSSYLSSSAAPILVTAGLKQSQETYNGNFDMCKPAGSRTDHECFSKIVTVLKAAVGPAQEEASHISSQYLHPESEEEQSDLFKPPPSKRRFMDSSLLGSDSQPLPQAWSQDPLLAASQYSESESFVTNQQLTTAKSPNYPETSFINDLQTEDAFEFQLDLSGRTSTQKPLNCLDSSQTTAEKENSKALSFNSPRKPLSLSHLGAISNPKWTEPKIISPQKTITFKQRKTADNKERHNSLFKCKNLRSSPFKKQVAEQQSREVDENSQAMLFTQDSEGFRVIAHRDLLTRSPLKDQTNVSCGTIGWYNSLEEDEEDVMLFTQDSQGNMVIKH